MPLKINTCNMVQGRRPYFSLSSLVYIMCRSASETMDHLLLHRPVALALWSRLFKEAALSWGNPESCEELFCESYSFFGGNKRGVVLKRCAMMAVF